MTTSPSASAQAPSTSFSGLKRSTSGPVSTPKPRLGAPCVLMALPSEPMIFVFVSSSTLPEAASTPGRAETSSTTDSSIGGATASTPWKLMSAPLPETMTSVPA